MDGYVYLIHIDPPLAHAKHYLGSTIDVTKRMRQHVTGNGNPLLKAAVDAGCNLEIVRVWHYPEIEWARRAEAKLKRQQHNGRYCPVCNDNGRGQPLPHKR